jgi:hypothetical protein
MMETRSLKFPLVVVTPSSARTVHHPLLLSLSWPCRCHWQMHRHTYSLVITPPPPLSRRILAGRGIPFCPHKIDTPLKSHSPVHHHFINVICSSMIAGPVGLSFWHYIFIFSWIYHIHIHRYSYAFTLCPYSNVFYIQVYFKADGAAWAAIISGGSSFASSAIYSRGGVELCRKGVLWVLGIPTSWRLLSLSQAGLREGML